MDEWQFFLVIALMLPALYYTMKFIVWLSERVERKK